MYELAQKVNGWGKIELVERISPETQEIKDWFLRNGCQNNIMNEYLAYTCAVKGELHEALKIKNIDDALYDGAGDIISALISGGPTENIDDYEFAPEVLEAFLEHAVLRCNHIPQLTVVMDILNFLSEEDEQWSERYDNGWDDKTREQCKAICQKIIFQKHWEKLVWEGIGIQSDDNVMKWHSKRAAKFLNIDIWDELFNQLTKSPINSTLYFDLMRTNDNYRIMKLVDFAEKTLPLDQIASGPGEEMGLGPDFEAHSCLDFIVQDLDKHPGIGMQLIVAALWSPVVRNRNMALNALETWPIETWNNTLITKLNELEKSEPDLSVKKRITMLMKQKAIS